MVKRGVGMNKVVLLSLLVIASVFAFASFASADISFSSPSAVYNLGDDFNISLSLSAASNTNGFLKTSLVCGTNEVLLFMSPYKLSSGEQETIPLSFRLDKSLIGLSSGNCTIRAIYNQDTSTSQNFEISQDLLITVNLDQTSYNPSDSVIVSGNVTKKDNKLFSGNVEITIPDLSLTKEVQAQNGQFSAALTIPAGAKADLYSLKVSASESLDNEVTNFGEAESAILVNQIPVKLEIAPDSQEVTPGNNLGYKVILTDQTGQAILDKDARVTIVNPSGEVKELKIVKSGSSSSFNTLSNSSAGNWVINATLDSLTAEKSFKVLEMQSASFSLVNNTLTVTNIGNIFYNKTIQVAIGNVTKAIDAQISLGKSKQFKLEAPKGEYAVTANDGSSNADLGKTLLTGRAVDVTDLTGTATGSYMIIGWIVIALVLLWFAYRIYKKSANKAFYGKTSYFSPIKVSAASEAKESAGISSTSITHGEKRECAVIALKIRNLEEIERSKSNAMESINIALAKARNARASVFEQNNFRMIVIPAMVVKDDLSITAAKLVKDVESTLIEHNKKYSQKIDFGIGANIGELIVERKQNNKFRFGAMGNTIQLARKIADSARNEALISEPIRNKAMKDIKVEKKGDYYSITRIVDRDSHSEFISRFMNRNKPGQ